MENICGHYDKDLGCLVTFDGSCCKEECFTYRLLLLLQAKVQECEELKKTIMYKCPQCGEVYLSPIGASLYDENIKLKQTLTEIKAICNNNDELQGDFNVVDCDKYKLGKHNLANKILQKIKECEVEE